MERIRHQINGPTAGGPLLTPVHGPRGGGPTGSFFLPVLFQNMALFFGPYQMRR